MDPSKANIHQPSRTAEDPTDELLRLRKEVQHLRSETQELSTERDILRKAAKYFAVLGTCF